MERTLSCRLRAEFDGCADVVLSVAVAREHAVRDERLAVTLDGAPLAPNELLDVHGTRLHQISEVGSGVLEVEYDVVVEGHAPTAANDATAPIRYLRPSRYCESDRLTAYARGEFASLTGIPLLDAVSSWVGTRTGYVAGSSRPTDGAVDTLLTRRGVCRDFAHLVIALLRGCDTPARIVSVYAPGLEPMDFHAVVEAYVEDAWLVVDATRLAPRQSMVRIATGHDAAETAFLTTTGATVELTDVEVTATVDGELPIDDLTQTVRLA